MISKAFERLRRMDTDQCLFLIGNIFLAFAVLTGIIVTVCHVPLGTGEDCAFHKYTGLYCFGCGGTRAMFAFLHGRFITSMKYNIFTAYGMTVFTIFMGSHYLRKLTRGRVKGLHFRLAYIIIGVVLLVGHFMLRNIMLMTNGSILWPVG